MLREKRRIYQAVLLLVVVVSALNISATKVNALAPDTSTRVMNVHIGGFMDPHNQSLIHDTLQRAEQNYDLYVIQLDSDGVAGADIFQIATDLQQSKIPTAIWIGPTSASYSNELDEMVSAADFLGAANDTLAKKSGASFIAPSLREFLAELDNQVAKRLDFVLDTGCTRAEVEEKTEKCKEVHVTNDDEKFILNITPTFEKLSPIANLGHSLIKPSFAIGLVVLGLCLIAFEFFAASIGIAAIAGTILSICGFYGLGYLPTNWWAVGLVMLGVFALVIDVQAGGVGLYSAVGTLLLVIGSFFTTSRVESYGVTIAGVVIITIMALLFCIAAIPSLIRTRFGTPTIGREEFIGELGMAVGEINPEGIIRLRDATWKARTNQATPIADGQECKVTAIHGIELEVEPLIGAAKDYRQ